jgi:hypothetical protein
MWFFVLLYSHMTWAARRRLLIVCILLLLAGGVVYWRLSPQLFVAPTCSDSIQNGNETGIDCGGTMCSIMCSAEVMTPTVLWARAFPVTDTVYNAAAYIENKNNAAVRQIAYEFRLYDDNNILITRRDGTTIIPPLGRYAIVETGLQSGTAKVARTTFTFSSTPALWERVAEATGKLRVSTSSITLDASGTTPKLSARIGNPSPTATLENITVAAILYDADDNAVNVSRTTIPTLMPERSTPVVFTWPRALSAPVVRYEILPLIDVFNAH